MSSDQRRRKRRRAELCASPSSRARGTLGRSPADRHLSRRAAPRVTRPFACQPSTPIRSARQSLSIGPPAFLPKCGSGAGRTTMPGGGAHGTPRAAQIRHQCVNIRGRPTIAAHPPVIDSTRWARSSPSTRRPASCSAPWRRSAPTRSRRSSTMSPRCSRSGPSSRSPTGPATCAARPTSCSPIWTRSRRCSPASRASRSPRATRWSCCRRSTRCIGARTPGPRSSPTSGSPTRRHS